MRVLYKYSGPVLRFDTIVTSKWDAETYAESEAKAKNNLAYQFKKKFRLKPTTRITLPGKVIPDYNQRAM